MSRRVMFADRSEAGRLLAERLATIPLAPVLVLALPRGGVAVGAEIARRLQAPLGVAPVRKIGAPGQPELAIGGLRAEFVWRQAAQARVGLETRRVAYAPPAPPVAPAARAVIVVDDGVATGMTMCAALRQVRRRGPRRLIAAVPVGARNGLALIAADADDVVCLASPRRFGAVAAFYRSFPQLTDEDVGRLLREAAAPG